MINKLLAYRIFADEQGKMNLSVADINGGVLMVSQFTLVADTKSGTRAGFSTAKSPVLAEALYAQEFCLIKRALPQD
jgi:D-tyrosyl-tRNA(Tyr) deacylase